MGVLITDANGAFAAQGLRKTSHRACVQTFRGRSAEQWHGGILRRLGNRLDWSTKTASRRADCSPHESRMSSVPVEGRPESIAFAVQRKDVDRLDDGAAHCSANTHPWQPCTLRGQRTMLARQKEVSSCFTDKDNNNNNDNKTQIQCNVAFVDSSSNLFASTESKP
jgi:hypothetical protein